MYQNAVAQVLQQQGAPAARSFLEVQHRNMGDARYATLRSVLDALGTNPTGDATETVSQSLIENQEVFNSASQTAVAAVAAEATHGNPKAIGPYTWYLLGVDGGANIDYGYCSVLSGCVVVGAVRAFEQSNVNFQPEAFWQTYMRQAWGQHASFSGHKVRMMRDKSGGTDPTILTLGCSTSGTNALDCTFYPNTPTTVGYYYYYREDVKLTYASGSTVVQLQTRRWVNSGGTISFPAYYNGG